MIRYRDRGVCPSNTDLPRVSHNPMDGSGVGLTDEDISDDYIGTYFIKKYN